MQARARRWRWAGWMAPELFADHLAVEGGEVIEDAKPQGFG
jgi:hypothetical protein